MSRGATNSTRLCVSMMQGDARLIATLRFLWNATRGHHLRPWKSEYVRWRIETYSGLHAESVDARAFFRFLMQERGRLIHFFLWTARMNKAAAK